MYDFADVLCFSADATLQSEIAGQFSTAISSTLLIPNKEEKNDMSLPKVGIVPPRQEIGKSVVCVYIIFQKHLNFLL